MRTRSGSWRWRVSQYLPTVKTGAGVCGQQGRTKTMVPVTEAFMTARERTTCLVRQKPRTRVRWMRTGTENLSANFTALPNRASMASPYFSSHAGLAGTAG